MILEFETQVNNDSIQLPKNVAAQLKNGTAIHVSIREVEIEVEGTQESLAWDSFLNFVAERALSTGVNSYSWKREDAYEHLK